MPPPRQVLDSLVRALRNRNYKLFFLGQGTSLIGTWLTKIATSWLVYRLAREQGVAYAAAMLGWANFAGMFPTLIFGPLGGTVADRVNRRNLLIVTQIISLLQSVALAALTFLNVITIPHVIWLSVLQGVINAFDMPARQSFLVEIVEDRADLPNAIALNSSMFNGARLVGPAVAGALIASVGEAWCFTIDAVSYFAVVVALFAMIVAVKEPGPARAGMLAQMREGFVYSFGFPPIRALLILVAAVSMFTMPFMTLMPLVADRLSGALHGAQSYGLLMAASGVGALSGSVYLAARTTVRGLSRVILFAALLLGVALVGFGFSNQLSVSLVAMLFAGFGMIAVMASSNTILQTIVEDSKRGRVMSFYTMSFMGTAPLGSLAAGWAAGAIGERLTIAISGCGVILAGLIFWRHLPALRALVRPIYSSKGIIPEVAAGMQSAASIGTATER